MSERYLDTQRCMELATAITITALQTGNIKFENAEDVADFYGTVAMQICDNAFITEQDLSTARLQKRNQPKNPPFSEESVNAN